MEKEIYKDIMYYEKMYQISNNGIVWNKYEQRKEHILTEPNGRQFVLLLAKNGKRKREYIDRLVALTYIDNPSHLPKVFHTDGNITNNNYKNLKWKDVE